MRKKEVFQNSPGQSPDTSTLKYLGSWELFDSNVLVLVSP